ncbi:MAG: glycosyltransferase [Acidobacteria bacterium]|nr:glycosyltransferase [Acidobacteriota bacterium]
MPAAPRVSVLIPCYHSHTTLGACLAALKRQTMTSFEVVVVNSSQDAETGRVVQREMPEAVFSQCDKRLLPHAARNRAAAMASGEILVFTDPDCRLCPEALQLMVRAIESGHDPVGGAVEGEDADGWFLRGVHYCKFSWWLSGGWAEIRPDVPTAIVAYSRDLWLRVGPFMEEYFCGDTLLSYRLLELGCRPWFEPRIRVWHTHRCNLRGFLAERYQRGADFGRARWRFQSWSRARLALYLAAVPALPAVMAGRSLRYSAGSGRLLEALGALPLIFSGNAAWCLGEAVSHWRGLWRNS